MSRIEELGPVRFLIVPNRGHRLDLKPWKNRYPDARIIAPSTAREAVMEAAPVDATTDIIGDPDIEFRTVAGTKEDEFALIIRRGDDKTLILNDILSNVRHPKGLGAQVVARLLGFGDKRPSRPVRLLFVKDLTALAKQFRAWAAMPQLRRIIVAHGDIIYQAPREALIQAAVDFEH